MGHIKANAAALNPLGSCDIVSPNPGLFQVKAMNMPVTIQLCDAPGKAAANCTLNGVSVFPDGSTPSSVTSTEFSLALAVGKYNVAMGLVPKPGCGLVFAYEKCASPNPICLDTMAPQIQPSGIFAIEVM
jgi:hypothetical protein